MPRKAEVSMADWGHAKPPDFSIPRARGKAPRRSSATLQEAARHHRQAAKLYRSAQHEKASHHAHLAYAQQLQRGACRGSRQGSNEITTTKITKTVLRVVEIREGKRDESEHERSVEGKLHEIVGDVKKKAGQVTNDPSLETEGQSEKFRGQVQKKVGQIEKVFEKMK